MKKILLKFIRWIFCIPEPKKEKQLTKYQKAELARKEIRKIMRTKKERGGGLTSP